MIVLRPFSIVLIAAFLAVGSTAATAQMAQPGPEHEAMKQLAGEWEGTVQIQMPGMPEPATSAVTESVRLDHGGLWLISRFEGSMMGAPYSGQSIMGYDQAQKKYVEVWVDSFRSEIQQIEGSYDAGTRTWTKSLQSKHPVTGEPIVERHTQRVVDADHVVYEMALPGPDGDYLTYMKVDLTRAK
jgi:hypothetical protein